MEQLAIDLRFRELILNNLETKPRKSKSWRWGVKRFRMLKNRNRGFLLVIPGFLTGSRQPCRAPHQSTPPSPGGGIVLHLKKRALHSNPKAGIHGSLFAPERGVGRRCPQLVDNFQFRDPLLSALGEILLPEQRVQMHSQVVLRTRFLPGLLVCLLLPYLLISMSAQDGQPMLRGGPCSESSVLGGQKHYSQLEGLPKLPSARITRRRNKLGSDK